MSAIASRPYAPADAESLIRHGLHPILAKVYAARGVRSPSQLDYEVGALPRYDQLKGAEQMGSLLADAVETGQRVLVIADYDSDGATACAVAVRALRAMGGKVDYLVPNRFEYGYGLTPEIVRLAAQDRPDILLTVDNGIASVAGVEEANRLGMRVLITDHHLPGESLPDAAAIVNPNQPGCGFPSRNLAGVGVVFYVMLALRAELRRRSTWGDGTGPNLGKLLDLVALGTVADVVKLDDVNRILVDAGLKRIRAGAACEGIRALFRVAGRHPDRAATYDLGFILGPRLNAAGRLDDMSLGIECLTIDDPALALDMAQRLDVLNRERREIEAEMQQSALHFLDGIETDEGYSLSLFQPEWHQGVIGILAGRLKDKFHRPVVAFAPGAKGEIKGSGRSIPGLHLRDALDLLSKRHPDLISRFGGHAMAAGLTIREEDFLLFRRAFEETVRDLLTPADLERLIETDGELGATQMEWELARALGGGIWGQGFPEPSFHGEFRVVEQRTVGGRHLKLRLERERRIFDAILFFHADPLPEHIRAVYALVLNEYNGNVSLQMTIRHWENAITTRSAESEE